MVGLYLALCCIVGALVLFPARSVGMAHAGAERAQAGAGAAARAFSFRWAWRLAAIAQIVLPIVGFWVMKEVHLGASSSAAIPFIAALLGVGQVFFLLGVTSLLVGGGRTRGIARGVLAVMSGLVALLFTAGLVLFGAGATIAVFAVLAVGFAPAAVLLAGRG
jgi:hypothetical protein